MHRRTFGKHLLAVPFVGMIRQKASPRLTDAHIKLSCNVYSFNEQLRSGEMSLEEVVAFCADVGFDAIDPTGYYFPGYPEPPDDAYVYHIKKTAFLQGLDISGTGVRNDFTDPDSEKRAADLAHIKRWVEVAAKLDAPVLRVFAGTGIPDGHTRDEVYDWVVEGIEASVEYGRQHGVMIVLQHHDELLKTVEDVLTIRNRITSDWFGLNVDIGSLRTGDPYEQIAQLAPYAYTWQIKEHVYRNEQQEETDVNEIARILKETGYRGYIPLETLRPSDPREALPRFVDDMKQALQ